MQFAALLITACGLFTTAAIDLGAATLPPNLKILVDQYHEGMQSGDHKTLLDHVRSTPLKAVVAAVAMSDKEGIPGTTLPIVIVHGMGDSCFEPGLSSVIDGIRKRTGSYTVCFPIAIIGEEALIKKHEEDLINGYLMDMDTSVSVFASKVQSDNELKGGFHAIGFSQGSSIIRGYIEKSQDSSDWIVDTFLSVHGNVMGVAGFPACFVNGLPVGAICTALNDVLETDLAYEPAVQLAMFQAGYYRDPIRADLPAYLQNSQIAQWNNEGIVNDQYKINFLKTSKFVMVMAEQDRMLFDKKGEQWGSIPDGAFGAADTMFDTKFYKEDLFGLYAVTEACHLYEEKTAGDHLEFTADELYGWVDKHLIGVPLEV